MRKDLNVVVGGGRNWNIPAFLPVLLRYVSGPILSIIFSFAYPEFYTLRYDPMMVAGFILAHILMLFIIIGFIMPRYYNPLIPAHRRDEGTEETIVDETKGLERGVDLYSGRVGEEAGLPPYEAEEKVDITKS